MDNLANIAQRLGQTLNEKNGKQPAGDDRILEYFRRIRDGQDTGQPKHIITGNLDKWRSFDWQHHPDLLAAKRVIVDWSKGEATEGGGLILVGNCGCGKSHIARAIAEARGPLARYVNEIELVKSIQATYSDGNGKSEESILFRLQQSELLIFDDLGAYETKNLEWIQGIYYALFNDRKERGRAMLITTNLPLFDHTGGSPLEDRVGARTFSRILGQVGGRQNFIDLFRVPDYRVKDFE